MMDTIGIRLVSACSARRWFAHGEVCQCPCGGENHGAMMPGRNKLQNHRGGDDRGMYLVFPASGR